jgi:uncharacterized OB-fold protein
MPTPSRYWREIPQRYRLEAARCKDCSRVTFPPRLVCPSCRGRAFETVKLAETGTLLTWTVIRVAPDGFEDQAPYAVGIVELDELGVRLTAQVVDCDFSELKVGLPVKIEFRKLREEGEAGIIHYGYKFVPA